MSTALKAMMLSLAMIVAACGGEGTPTTSAAPSSTATTTSAPAGTTETPTSSTTTTTTTVSRSTSSSTSTASTSTTAATTTTTTPPTTTTLPGEPIDIGPGTGDVLIVAGVAFDDMLNVREIPGLGGSIVDTLQPLATGVTAIGRNRLLPTSIWYQIDTGSVVGWASGRYLFFEGFTDDLTAEVVADLGEIPTGSTVDEIAAVVATSRASVEPMSDITIASEATSGGDLREIIVDVIGLGDDALGGERLHLFVEPLDGGGFMLDTVERTLLCSRGTTDDGLCQ